METTLSPAALALLRKIESAQRGYIRSERGEGLLIDELDRAGVISERWHSTGVR